MIANDYIELSDGSKYKTPNVGDFVWTTGFSEQVEILEVVKFAINEGRGVIHSFMIEDKFGIERQVCINIEDSIKTGELRFETKED